MFLASSISFAQVQTPQPSPSAQLSQTVGLTEVTVKYSRPSKKDRDIFGALVPFGKIWRTGANQNTIISFGDAVTIGDEEIAAGDYAIYTRPGKTTWEVFFYDDTSNWGNPAEWDASKVAASIEVPAVETDDMQSFEIWISNLHNNGATLNIGWSTTMVSVPFGVPTVAKATASIIKAMKNDPKDRDYYNAAVYYLQEGQDLNQAKVWIAKAIAGNGEAYWYFRQQSLILAGLNDVDGAIAAGKSSLALATKAGNTDYITLNETSLAEWIK
tara:strand:+ start:259 stop:1071 length:813 start_codon:yes stop_codon:yes gene_type:complete